MKNTFKKYLSLALALIVCVGALSVFAVGAEDAADPLDQNLVIHYDFEGADMLEAVKDKAPSGTAADDLEPIAGLYNYFGLMIDSKNGTVGHIDGTAGLKTMVSEDSKVVTGVSSWFVRTKLQNLDTNQYFEILDMRIMGGSGSRPFCLLYDKTNKQFVVGISPVEKATKANNLRFDYDYNYDAGKYVNLAVVVSQAEIDGKLQYQASLFMALDLPQTASDWTLMGTKTIGVEIAPTLDTTPIRLGSFGAADSALGVTLDDVRLYNKALTLDEIATIIPNGSFDKGLYTPDINNPGVADTEPEDTTPTETQPTETQPTETQPTETQPTETQPTETQPTETQPTESEPTEDTTPDTDEVKGGCGSAIGASVALVAISVFGAAIVSKKKD